MATNPITPILYVGEKNISSWSMRGYLAMLHKRVPFEEKEISLTRDKSRALRREVSPTGKVPVLHHVREGARLVIPDSLAILEYLEETFPPPAHPALWPEDPARRVRARWMAATMHSGFAKLRESMSFNLCFLPKPPEATPEALAEAAEVLDLWEKALSEAGPFLCGAYGGADIMFAPVVWRLTAFRVEPQGRPRAKAWMSAMLEHPDVRRWMDPARALTPVASY
ncbi:MAG: glutathione S-transferase family protein [Candidatus Polarisedimenticolia bacterium]